MFSLNRKTWGSPKWHCRGHRPYDVRDFYKDNYAGRLARSNYFELLTISIIFVNAFWIGYDQQFNRAGVVHQAEPVYMVADNFFCAYFMLEIGIRFQAFATKRRCLRDGWFIFDSFLVCQLVLDKEANEFFILENE